MDGQGGWRRKERGGEVNRNGGLGRGCAGGDAGAFFARFARLGRYYWAIL
jgi:hypothetical protein